MNASHSKKISVGLFVIAGTILFISTIYIIGQKQDLFKDTITLNAYFQNINGLQKGNNVRYSGINIGTVYSLEMKNDSTVNVEMHIDQKIVKYIKKNAIATIGTDGLVGNMIINIVQGKGTAEEIQNGDVIATYSRISPEDILNTLGVSSDNTALLTADLLKITAAITSGKGPLNALVYDTLLINDLKQSVNNLKIASEGAANSINNLNQIALKLKQDQNTLLGTFINDTIAGNRLKATFSHLEQSGQSIQKTTQEMSHFLKHLNMSQGSVNYILNDTVLVDKLQATMNNIEVGTAKFNENMEALKHSFLTRRYFRKIERQKKREKKGKN